MLKTNHAFILRDKEKLLSFSSDDWGAYLTICNRYGEENEQIYELSESELKELHNKICRVLNYPEIKEN